MVSKWRDPLTPGTISQRENHFEMWADAGYMIPPSFASIGLLKGDADVMRIAVDQWNLQKSVLFNPDAGMWRHVHYWDTKLWATGQAWQLGGGLRVLASARAAGLERELAPGLQKIEDTLAHALYAVLGQLDVSMS
jgi:rhamnogalacturonyl hydrolase YesR